MKSTLDVFEGMMLFFLRESKATLTRDALDELLEAWYELRRAAEAEDAAAGDREGRPYGEAEEPRAAEGVGPYGEAEEPRAAEGVGPYEGAEEPRAAEGETGEDPRDVRDPQGPQEAVPYEEPGPEIPEGFEAVQPVKSFTGTGAKLKRETLEKLEARRKGGMSLEALSLKTGVPTDALARMINREKVELKAWEKVAKALGSV